MTLDLPDEQLRLTEALTKLALSLLKEHSLTADLDRLVRVTCQLIADCSGGSVSMLIEGEPSTVATTDRVTLQLDVVQYDNNEGPCIAALGGESVRIGFVPTDERFPHFAAGAADRRVLSVLSTPAIDHGRGVGSRNLYSRREDGFDERDRSTALVMAAEVANALVKSALAGTATDIRDQLQRQHDTAVMFSRAQGVLMAIQECSAAQAGDLIRRAAEDNAEPLIVTAERILAAVRAETEPAPPT
jgi:GAF domain-containing protein